jgi:hypothetical protein
MSPGPSGFLGSGSRFRVPWKLINTRLHDDDYVFATKDKSSKTFENKQNIHHVGTAVGRGPETLPGKLDVLYCAVQEIQ